MAGDDGVDGPRRPRLALADRRRGPDAGRRRRHAVLDRPDGVPAIVAAGGPVAALERPLGVRLPGAGREPDGGVLPAASPALLVLPGRDRLYRQPGDPHRLGRPRRRVGRAAVRRLASRVGAERVRLGDLGVLPDPPAAPVGVHRGELDALGLGAGMAGRPGRGGPPHALDAGPGPDPPGLAGPLPARVHHRGRCAGPRAGERAAGGAGIDRGGVGPGVDDPDGGGATAADVRAGPALRLVAGLRIPLRLRRDPPCT